MIDNFRRKSNGWTLLMLIGTALSVVSVAGLWLQAEEPTPPGPKPASPGDKAASPFKPVDKPTEKQLGKPLDEPLDPPGLTRLSPNYPVWVDKEHKRVVMVGEICQDSGALEMFACQKNTKEHEAIVAVDAKAYLVHAGLLATGAVPGAPVQFRPEYKPAHGTEVDVLLYWTDAKGERHQAKAQDWILHAQTGKHLEHPWVFAGSGFWVNPNTKERHYMAEDGDLICVSNFTTAMLDLPVESSAANNTLMFEADKAKVPPKKTRLSVVLVPRLKDLKPDRGSDPKAEPFAPPSKVEGG